MIVPDTRALGRIIRERRKATGLTTVRAAAMTGLSRRLLSELERGTRRNVGTQAVFRILDLLGLRMDVEPRAASGTSPIHRGSPRA
ncbi:MAG: helix-turn-helix domain-containing protein [Gemmatimonadota bacterium]